MSKSIKRLLSVISVTLCILIAFTLPVQVFAQNLPLNEEITVSNPQEAKPYEVGSILSEIKSEREEYTKRFRLDDGTNMAVSYNQPVHYQDASGNWVDYDNRLVDETTSSATNDEAFSEEYTNKKSNIKVNYSKKSKENNMIKIKTDDYHVSWGYADTNKVSATVVESNEELEGNDKFTTLTNLTSEVIYENIYDNVDIQYITTSVGIKENIILKNSNTRNEFTIQYKINSLTAKQVNDWLIELLDNSGNVVYSIEAPFMVDSANKTSTQLALSIIEQKNSKLTLKLSADKEFLSTATYPVTIDPHFITSQNWQKSECSYVDDKNPNTAYGYESDTGYTGNVKVGTYGIGMYRTYFKMKSLPTLNNGDMIVSANFNIHSMNNNFYKNMYIGAYYVTGSWSQSTITWNNQPTYETTNLIDYETYVKNDPDAWHDWDVTECVKRWYNGETNNGIMLMSTNESAELQCAAFYSANHPTSIEQRPLFEIHYRNNKGIEDYWTYSSFQVGTVGTAYINDYSGNLVFVTNDAVTTSGYAPASVQHVYNNYMAGKEYEHSKPYSGVGWMTNLQQTLLPSSDFGLSDESQDLYPYVYTDGDGTDHYFYEKDENDDTYYDEDGLNLELTVNESDASAKYTITNDKDGKMVFNSSGLLQYTQDANGNKITINYVNNTNTISSVTDATGNKITLELNSSNYIRYITDQSGRKIEYIYNTSKQLSQIKYPNGTSVYFTYDSDESLSSITDVDGYKVTFTYTSLASGKKVSSIQERGKNGTLGQKITFDRTLYNTTKINSYGADGIANTDDDLTTTYQFDNFGRTVSTQCKTPYSDLGASVYTYTDGKPNETASNIKQLNRVSTAYSTNSSPVNFVRNPNMEITEGDKIWEFSAWDGTNTFTYGYTINERYFGSQSLEIHSTAYQNISSARAAQFISNTVLKPGRTYTISGYIKTKNITNYGEDSGALLCAESLNSDGTYNRFQTEYVKGNTSTDIDNGWQRVSTTFKVPSNSNQMKIHLALRASTGYAYFDGIQIEWSDTVNSYNMVENAGLENYSSDGLPTYWYEENSTLDTSNVEVSTKHVEGTSSFAIKGDPTAKKSICQQIMVRGTEQDTYILSGWALAYAVPIDEDKTRTFNITAKICYSDGKRVIKPAAEFNTSISNNTWQYTSTAFTLDDGDDSISRYPTSVTIYLNYDYQANYVYFDNIYLAKDNAQSYTYDSEGNVVSVVNHSKEQSTMEYTNSDLIKDTDAKGFAYTYDYDDNHNMTKATSQNGVNYNYTYNNKGLATSLEVKGTNVKSLKSEITYDGNGQVITAKDQDGNQVTYTYNDGTDTLASATDDSGTTSYTYDSTTDILTSVSKYDDFEEVTYSVGYEYSDDSKFLEKITHEDTEYNLEYDEFGNKTNSKVGTQSLASYTYNANNGAMTSSTYGTGQTVSYTYDEYGNVARQKYNGTTAFEWFSDRSGNVVRQKDYINNLEYSSTFDSTGRLVRQIAKDTTATGNTNNHRYSFEYGYDENNNIKKFSGLFPLFSFTNEFAYGKDNLLSTYKIESGKNVTYTYDGLNRLTKTSLSTARNINTTYSYYDSERGSGYTTTKLESETIDGVTYTYEYDTLGNITDIYRGNTHLYYYEYDAMNQLIYVRDYENSKTYTYAYDTAGNLIAENISDVTSNGTAYNTVYKSYQYNDTNWGDKLTSYDGQTITYDAIGNPLSYRDGMTMTWKNGRQLATLQDSDDNISYTYDSESVRTSKTIDGVKHTYAYLGGKLMYETRGNAKFYYSYDANGVLYSVKYTLTDTSAMQTYFFTHNSRGDIIGIYDSNGTQQVKYDYDAWGNILSITDSQGNAITDQNHIANLNPFRYRGYYYDSETGLYYLMSRYYDPVTHRFINADGYFQSSRDILDTNMSAYCGNNPIMYFDPTGAITSKEILLDIVNNPNSKYTVKDATIAQRNESKKYEYEKSYGHSKENLRAETTSYEHLQSAGQVEYYYNHLKYDDYDYYMDKVDDYSSFIPEIPFNLDKLSALQEIISDPYLGTIDDFGNQLYIEKGYSLITYSRVYWDEGCSITEDQYILFNRENECVFNKTVDTSIIYD